MKVFTITNEAGEALTFEEVERIAAGLHEVLGEPEADSATVVSLNSELFGALLSNPPVAFLAIGEAVHRAGYSFKTVEVTEDEHNQQMAALEASGE